MMSMERSTWTFVPLTVSWYHLVMSNVEKPIGMSPVNPPEGEYLNNECFRDIIPRSRSNIFRQQLLYLVKKKTGSMHFGMVIGQQMLPTMIEKTLNLAHLDTWIQTAAAQLYYGWESVAYSKDYQIWHWKLNN